jgi:hypothetical protein
MRYRIHAAQLEGSRQRTVAYSCLNFKTAATSRSAVRHPTLHSITSSAGFFKHKYSNWFFSTNSSGSSNRTGPVIILVPGWYLSCDRTGPWMISVLWSHCCWSFYHTRPSSHWSRDHTGHVITLVLWSYRPLIPILWSFRSFSHIRPLS